MAGSAIRSDVPVVSVHASGRLASLDQFRGYTVLGMIVVNFIGGFTAVHSVFKHNDNHFSFADSIMPSFHFAVGFALRMTYLKRIAVYGESKATWRIVQRSLALIAIAVLFFGAGGGFQDWKQFESYPSTWVSPSLGDEGVEQSSGQVPFYSTFLAQWVVYLALLLKSQMWNTFAIIGATQLVILPLIGTPTRIRVKAIVLFAALNFTLTALFNWGFVLADPVNWMVRLWRTGGASSWDGGFFGPLCWAVVMLAGTLAHDVVVASSTSTAAASRMFRWGCVVMVIAYAMSCLTRFYDVELGASPNPRLPGFAANPIVPDPDSLGQRPWTEYLAEPPFVAPPGTTYRLGNYWMMTKQIPSLSFILFATGFAAAVYGVFVLIADVWHVESGVLSTFGKNPLAAYVIHAMIGNQLGPLVPSNAPFWYCMAGLACYLVSVFVCVRGLERAGIFIRL